MAQLIRLFGTLILIGDCIGQVAARTNEETISSSRSNRRRGGCSPHATRPFLIVRCSWRLYRKAFPVELPTSNTSACIKLSKSCRRGTRRQTVMNMLLCLRREQKRLVRHGLEARALQTPVVSRLHPTKVSIFFTMRKVIHESRWIMLLCVILAIVTRRLSTCCRGSKSVRFFFEASARRFKTGLRLLATRKGS